MPPKCFMADHAKKAKEKKEDEKIKTEKKEDSKQRELEASKKDRSSNRHGKEAGHGGSKDAGDGKLHKSRDSVKPSSSKDKKEKKESKEKKEKKGKKEKREKKDKKEKKSSGPAAPTLRLHLLGERSFLPRRRSRFRIALIGAIRLPRRRQEDAFEAASAHLL